MKLKVIFSSLIAMFTLSANASATFQCKGQSIAISINKQTCRKIGQDLAPTCEAVVAFGKGLTKISVLVFTAQLPKTDFQTLSILTRPTANPSLAFSGMRNMSAGGAYTGEAHLEIDKQISRTEKMICND